MGKISPSMMCADICDLKSTLRTFETNGIEYLHIDIMDGHFVPNFALGTDYCRRLKSLTAIPLDIHLMVSEPEKVLDWFEFGKGDIVSVHTESTAHLQKVLAAVRSRGAKAFAALNPATPLSVLEYVADDIDGVLVMAVNPGFAGQKMIPSSIEKIRRLKRFFDENGYSGKEIEVDGNVSFANAPGMQDAGADIFVGGTSSIFAPGLTLADSIRKFRKVTG